VVTPKWREPTRVIRMMVLPSLQGDRWGSRARAAALNATEGGKCEGLITSGWLDPHVFDAVRGTAAQIAGDQRRIQKPIWR